MRESAREFQEMFYLAEAPPPDAPKNELQAFTFRSNAARKMDDLVESLKNIGAPVKREVVQVKGGC